VTPAAAGAASGPPASLVVAWERLRATGVRGLFAADADRADRCRAPAGPIEVDFARDLVDDTALALLVDEVLTPALPWLRAFLAGEPVNWTERRPAAHWALRAPAGEPAWVAGADVSGEVAAVLRGMRAFADGVRAGEIRTPGGERFTAVLNIGIGGSDLGPAMAYAALSGLPEVTAAGPVLTGRFLANVDPADAAAALAGLDPRTTLVVIASKTFTTSETLRNAGVVRQWLAAAVGQEAVAGHLAAVTAAPERAAADGIPRDRVFAFWDWVGGRFSLASAIGLPLLICLGSDAWEDLRGGMAAVDAQVRTTLTGPHRSAAELCADGVVLHALLWYWYHAVAGLPTHAVIPYSQSLARLPAYLQQLIMESNGKSVTRSGEPVSTPTSPIVFGEPGTNAQHSFFQLLHQGTQLVPVDLVVALHGSVAPTASHRVLLAHALAQASVLAFGDEGSAGHEAGPVPPAERMVGGRPVTVLTLPVVCAYTLGALIALYEHSTVIWAACLGINPFDQPGVELGKRAAVAIEQALASGVTAGLDPAAARLVGRFRQAAASEPGGQPPTSRRRR